MRKQVVVFLALYALSYVATLLGGLFFKPAPLANLMGFLSLLSYIATLLPGLLRAIFPALKKDKMLIWLLKYRRHIGVAAFGFGVNHGILLILERQVNFLEWHTYVHYFQGIATLAIFTILTLTSNDESVKSLKKDWKKLHQLTYLAIFILPWHILDKMAIHWTRLTPLGVLLSLTILVLFVIRKWREHNKPDKRQPPKPPKVLPKVKVLQKI